MGVDAATTDNDGEQTGRRKVLRVRSLAISPNLDKLLEHDERSRASTHPTPHNSMEAGNTTSPAGLSPPPRNQQMRSKAPRRNTSATSSGRFAGPEALHVLSELNSPPWPSNPYINPAPTAEELFLSSSHDSARPAPGPSQQSVHFNDHQHNLSPSRSRRSATGYRFRAQTLGKGGNFPVSPLLRLFTTGKSLDHGRRTHSPKEDIGIAAPTSDIEFQARFGISSAANSGRTLSNHSLDPTAHLSVIEICSPSNSDNRPSPSSSITQSMTSTPEERHGVKPPLPTTPKPVFSRHPSLYLKRSGQSSFPVDRTNVKPATTNFLDVEERADLVRKSRKLTRLFGETPNAEAVVNQAGLIAIDPAHRKKSEPDTGLYSHHRDRHGRDGFSRRYSLPLNVDNIPFIDLRATGNADSSTPRPSSNQSPEPGDGAVQSDSRPQADSIRPQSPVSFIEMSDDGSSTSVANRTSISSSFSSKTASIDLLDDERRSKRERLAKLYRFLGSQVPVSLALGTNDGNAVSLSPPRKHRPSGSVAFDNSENRYSTLLRRRRSSSAIPSSSWSDNVQRLKADLDDREKALIVRRAQKMEKLFGVAPPLTLYCPPSSAPTSGSTTPLRTLDLPSGSSATLKSSKQKENRPDTPESSRQLLSKRSDSSTTFDYHPATTRARTDGNGHSTFYKHYEHSLNSLNDIIDRDDKESLAELHQVLYHDMAVPHERSAVVTSGEDGTKTPTRSDHHHSSTSSFLAGSERRGSLPARTSMISLDSEYDIAMPPSIPDATSFQQRRKRAAKLTHFFGVDYRELFDDVLDSIENDMQLGQRDGELHAEEVEDLLQKLRKLRYKRQNFL